MTEIRLERETWRYDENLPLGPAGGFGAVFSGQASDGRAVAVKRLNLDAEASAHRELRIASQLAGKPTKHVIPIFDSGEDANSGRYFVVMAVAKKSLQADLDSGRAFSGEEVVDILLHASEGIAELDGFVHRDLKPGNLLFHEGSWKIADFGIAMFVEESTSLATLKDCLSPQYAAPEQWVFQRAEVATDLYALGCIGYRLLSGHLPYAGPTMENFREQHLHATPKALPDTVSPRLRTLVGMLLRKPPHARPSLNRVLELLVDIELTPGQQQPNSIAEVAARLEQALASEESSLAVQRAAEHSREELARSGRTMLGEIVARLRDRIVRDAPSAMQDNSAYVTLGQAQISLPIAKNFEFLKTVPPESFPHSKIDVLLAKTFEVHQLSPRYVWSSSLLFCRFPNEKDYRWYEVAFMGTLGGTQMAPFSLLEETTNAKYRYYHADFALSNTMHTYQAAFGPTPIDDENEDGFVERWMTVFGAAAEGRLKYPSRLPLAADFWRNLSSYGL
jgi:serine/threonine protein kinase